MFRIMQTAVLVGALGLLVAAVSSAQEPYPKSEPSTQPQIKSNAPMIQGGHLSEAIKHAQAAIDAGNSGQATMVAAELQTALTHAQAAEKESPSPNLEVAIKSLQEAVKQNKAGKTDDALKAAQEALAKLTA